MTGTIGWPCRVTLRVAALRHRHVRASTVPLDLRPPLMGTGIALATGPTAQPHCLLFGRPTPEVSNPTWPDQVLERASSGRLLRGRCNGNSAVVGAAWCLGAGPLRQAEHRLLFLAGAV